MIPYAAIQEWEEKAESKSICFGIFPTSQNDIDKVVEELSKTYSVSYEFIFPTALITISKN